MLKMLQCTFLRFVIDSSSPYYIHPVVNLPFLKFTDTLALEEKLRFSCEVSQHQVIWMKGSTTCRMDVKKIH